MTTIFQNTKNQTPFMSKAWFDKVIEREITKNHYRVTGDLQNAKEFVTAFTHYEVCSEHPRFVQEPITIFSRISMSSPT